jgi:hypothetical protein
MAPQSHANNNFFRVDITRDPNGRHHIAVVADGTTIFEASQIMQLGITINTHMTAGDAGMVSSTIFMGPRT